MSFLSGTAWIRLNARLVAQSARDLCRQESDSCITGVDCCTGFCSASAANTKGVCTPPPQRYANLDERCTTDADCCDNANLCINNFYAYVTLL